MYRKQQFNSFGIYRRNRLKIVQNTKIIVLGE